VTADQIFAALELPPHPESGHFRDETEIGGRALSTGIYDLLRADWEP